MEYTSAQIPWNPFGLLLLLPPRNASNELYRLRTRQRNAAERLVKYGRAVVNHCSKFLGPFTYTVAQYYNLLTDTIADSVLAPIGSKKSAPRGMYGIRIYKHVDELYNK